MYFVALLLLVTSPALAAPWDGPRSIQDGADLDGEPWRLDAVPGAFSVTWAPGVQDRLEGASVGPERLEVGGHQLVREGPLASKRYHTDRYQLVGSGDPSEVARALMSHPDAVVAGPLLSIGGGTWRAITDRVLLQSHGELSERALRQLAAPLLVEGRWGLAPNQVLLRVPPGCALDPVEAAMRLRGDPRVRWAQVDWIQPREERFTPEDDRFPNQWHLENTGQFGGLAGHDLKATLVWDISLGGEDVIVGVLDSGVELDHEDLQEDRLDGWDFVDGVPGGEPTTSNHGTRVAGVAAAPANGLGVVGVCPDCPILPGRVIGASDAAEAEAHDWAVEQGAWVINNSWGPQDGTGLPQPIAPVMAAALESAVVLGRDGLGTLVFWAAGNGHPNDTCTLDGLVAYPLTVGVASSTNAGVRSSYSEMCPELDLSSTSNGGTAAINTTQVGGYTSNFGGTSAAAPGATGSAALVLSVAPGLRWDTLRELLRVTADKLDPDVAAYDARGHSLSYGYGRVNPWAALHGGLLLERAGQLVSCTAALDVTVVLPLEPGLGAVEVAATSITDAETLTLDEDADGVYSGTLRLTDDASAEGDGLLGVATGGEVVLSSADVANEATLLVDCDVPILIEPGVDTVTPWTARIFWRTFDDAAGYASWAGGDGFTPLDTWHQVWALDLEPCTTYSADIEATDPLGNSARIEAAVSWSTPGDEGLIPPNAPDDADPCDPDTWGEEETPTPPWIDDDDSADEREAFGGLYDASGTGCGCSSGGGGALLVPMLLLLIRRRD